MSKTRIQHPAFEKVSHFRGQNKDERLIQFVRRHWIYVLARVTFLLLVLVGTPIVVFLVFANTGQMPGTTLPEQFFWGVLFATYLILGHRFFLNMIDYFFDIVLLTNLRVIDVRRSVFLHEMYEGMDLHKIREVKSDKDGFIQNLLRYGSVTINIEHTTQAKCLDFMAHPTHLMEAIVEYKRKYLESRRSSD